MESELDKRRTRIDLSSLPETSEFTTDQLTLAAGFPAAISDAAPKPKKRKTSPQGRHRIAETSQNSDISTTKPGMIKLKLSEAAKAGVSALEYIPIKRETPWNSFREDYELNLDGFVTIASQRAFPHDSVIVKLLKDSGVNEKFRMLQRIRHRNIHAVLECFIFQDCRYVVFEHVPISLSHVAKSPPYPSELELAAILAQLLNGLAYLASHGLEHGSLSCSNVLLSAEGEIKITGQERCREIGSSKQPFLRDTRAVGYITMELMQKYAKDDGAIGIEDLDRWPSASDAIGFLSMTTSASSVNELLQHPLLKRHWEKEDLKWLVGLAAVAANVGFNYQEGTKTPGRTWTTPS